MVIPAYSTTRWPPRAEEREPDSPAAHQQLTSVRRSLQLALAAVWLLDAALQFQPYMFTKGFVTGTLAPAARGNPAVVSAPMRWVFHLMVAHIGLFNAAFATIQLAIAAGLLWRYTVKVALAVSIAWALGVWWFGEGLGDVLAGASPVMGAPGAVVIYALVALLVWPRNDDTAVLGSVSDHGPLGRTGARLAWPILWGALAYLFLRPANRAPGALHDAIAGAANGEPAWLAAVDRHLAAVLAGNGIAASIALAVLCDLVAISIFVPRLARAGTVGAAAIGAFVWVGEGLGGIFTGRGTDPNSGLLLVLVAAAFWPVTRATAPAATEPRVAIREGAARRERIRPAPIWTTLDLVLGLTVSRAVPRSHFGSPPHSAKSESARTRGRRDRRIGLLAAVGLLVTGCAAAHDTTRTASAGQTDMATMPLGVSMPEMHMPPTTSMGHGPPVAAPPSPPVGPSQSAQMICSSEIRQDVYTALALPPGPPPNTTWADSLYTCVYHLPPGPLVMAVKELKTGTAARIYFQQTRQHLAPTRPILGLASLGLPGSESTNGAVIFLKDDKILEVDASALPAHLGPNLVSRTDFAYQIATDILGCWTGR